MLERDDYLALFAAAAKGALLEERRRGLDFDAAPREALMILLEIAKRRSPWKASAAEMQHILELLRRDSGDRRCIAQYIGGAYPHQRIEMALALGRVTILQDMATMTTPEGRDEVLARMAAPYARPEKRTRVRF